MTSSAHKRQVRVTLSDKKKTLSETVFTNLATWELVRFKKVTAIPIIPFSRK